MNGWVCCPSWLILGWFKSQMWSTRQKNSQTTTVTRCQLHVSYIYIYKRAYFTMKPAVRRQIWETQWFHIHKVVVHYMSENYTGGQCLLWWDRPPSGILHGWHVATSLPLLETMLDELKQESLAFLFTTPPKQVFLSLSDLWTTRQQRAQLSGCESVLIQQVNMLRAKILSYSLIHRLASCGLLCGRAGHTFATVVRLNVCQENIVAQLNVGFLFFFKKRLEVYIVE